MQLLRLGLHAKIEGGNHSLMDRILVFMDMYNHNSSLCKILGSWICDNPLPVCVLTKTNGHCLPPAVVLLGAGSDYNGTIRALGIEKDKSDLMRFICGRKGITFFQFK